MPAGSAKGIGQKHIGRSFFLAGCSQFEGEKECTGTGKSHSKTWCCLGTPLLVCAIMVIITMVTNPCSLISCGQPQHVQARKSMQYSQYQPKCGMSVRHSRHNGT
jgi:hypothetical protein